MKYQTNRSACLTRRQLLLLAGLSVSGCGGTDGGFGVTASLPGTGGTGLYIQGTISGFGSVIVNGIRFDDSQASVKLDGDAVTAADLRLGMVASVQGQRSADPTLGSADLIEVWSIAQGALAQAPTLTQRVQSSHGAWTEFTEFSLAGMTILTTPNTSFSGFSAASALLAGQALRVWGLQADASARRWTASRVALLPTLPTELVSSGLVLFDDERLTLNDMHLSGTANLTAQSVLRVQGTLDTANNTLSVTLATAVGLSDLAQNSDLQEFEIEGVVTSLPVGNSFVLGKLAVDTSALGANLPALQIGSQLKVTGSLRSGVLKANKIELEDPHSSAEVEIEAQIEQFLSSADFVLRAQHCDASHAAFSKGSAAELGVGRKIKLKGNRAGDIVIAATVEFKN